MPKPTKGPRFGGSPAHQRIILANLASQLFEHGKITTTEAKAKRVQPLAERLISKAKRGDLHNRRHRAADRSPTRASCTSLFTEIAPKLADREGGYTRITKIGPRKGDNAPMAVIEIVTETVEESRKAKAKAAPRRPSRSRRPSLRRRPRTRMRRRPVRLLRPRRPTRSWRTSNWRPAKSPTSVRAPTSARSRRPASTSRATRDSMKFHTPESQWYEQTKAEVWFNSVEAAEAAGFVNVLGGVGDAKA